MLEFEVIRKQTITSIMLSEVIDIEENMLRWRDVNKFRRELDFVTAKEMKDFIRDRRFWSYFESYVEKWIWSQQAKIKATNDTRDRESTLQIVKRRLLTDEDSRSDKYSNSYSNIANWDKIDF